MTLRQEKEAQLTNAFTALTAALAWFNCDLANEALFKAKVEIWHEIDALPEGYEYK